MRKIIIVLIAALAATAFDAFGADTKSVNIRQGRKIQVDGFLLEWKEADARSWPNTAWLWDAVSTADGVAGYVSLPKEAITDGTNTRVNEGINNDGVNNDSGINTNANTGINNSINTNITDSGINKSVDPNAAVWVFSFRAANTGKTVEGRIPGTPSGEFFAFDKEAFDRGESLTAEWIVPWRFFDDGEDADAYTLTISATNAADSLPTITISAAPPQTPSAPTGLMTNIAMITIVAILTVVLTLHRRKQMRESKPK